MGRTFNCFWWMSKPKVKDRFDMQPFLMRKLPIFCIMGPYGCGKSTLSCKLEKICKFHLINISQLVREELLKGKLRANVIEECLKNKHPIPDPIIITLMKEYIYINYTNAKGFIFCGFPRHLRQIRLFEFEICKVNIIIYCTLVLDALLGRLITKYGDINTEMVRKKYVRMCKECQKVHKNYDFKTLKVMANYPPEETCNKLVADLEDYWGFKFERAYSKN